MTYPGLDMAAGTLLRVRAGSEGPEELADSSNTLCLLPRGREVDEGSCSMGLGLRFRLLDSACLADLRILLGDMSDCSGTM